MNLQRKSALLEPPAATPTHVTGAQPRTMRAIVQDAYGSPSALRLASVDVPKIADHDVLIRVHAAGLHIGDWHAMRGLPYLMRVTGPRRPASRIRGMDAAGTVEAVGKNVTGLQVGDGVFGICGGAFAEFARASADRLAPKPTNLTFEQAAAVPTSGVTALRALRDQGHIQAAQKVLIVGASGGVGLFAVQIARAFGAEVTGVASSEKMELVRSLGADHVIDYTRQDFSRGGQRYDLIVDTGGNRSLSDLRRALAPRGTLVIVGGESDDRWFGGIGRQLRASMLSPFVGQRMGTLLAIANRADLLVLKDLIESGRVRPVIGRTYSLSEVPEAMRHLEERRALGKVVIRMP
jgi:NADPH:quinone reductase-like Zn-dependent oxidoreductase